jgi:CO/xanthine dehydrogenase Mo-binding subunit
MVRSPFAHARITGIDVREALALPGVTAVLTGADLRDAWAAPMPCAWPGSPGRFEGVSRRFQAPVGEVSAAKCRVFVLVDWLKCWSFLFLGVFLA